jgi:hypothetical protein
MICHFRRVMRKLNKLRSIKVYVDQEIHKRIKAYVGSKDLTIKEFGTKAVLEKLLSVEQSQGQLEREKA